MFRYGIFLILLFLCSCREYLVLQTNEYGTTVKSVHSEFGSVDVTNWDVDYPTKKQVSVGVILKVLLPSFRPDDIEYLYSKYKVDSWVVRLSFEHNFVKKVIGVISVRLDQGWGGSTEFINLRVFYNNAMLSQFQKRFNCPVKNHDKIIDDYVIKSLGTEKRDMFIMAGELLANVEEQSITPQTLNAGDSLAGSYTVEYALYSRSDKKIYSDFFTVDGRVTIGDEKTIRYESCKKED